MVTPLQVGATYRTWVETQVTAEADVVVVGGGTTAGALCTQVGVTPRDIDVARLRSTLLAQGAAI